MKRRTGEHICETSGVLDLDLQSLSHHAEFRMSARRPSASAIRAALRFGRPILLPPSSLEVSRVETAKPDIPHPTVLALSMPKIDKPVAAGVAQPSYSGIGVPSDITQLKHDIEKVSHTERARKERRKPAPGISRAEKRDFDLRPENLRICEMAKRYGYEGYFLDISLSDQATIKQWVKEERLEHMKQESATKNEQRKLRDHEQQTQRIADGIRRNSRLALGMGLHRRPLRYRDLEQKLRDHTCQFVRQGRGSHEVWKSKAGNTFPVPRHPGDLKTGTLAGIINRASRNSKWFGCKQL